MRRGAAALATAVAALLTTPGGAMAAEPPEGAAISDNLEYVTRVADARGITEGKFDQVGGRDVLVITGRFGFRTLDVSDPANPQPLDSFLPADLAENGYWQNEDMELDTRRKLIIGALDPRHTDSPLGACPAGGSTRIPACRSGFYVISYADPANLEQVGDFVELPSGHTSSCIRGCRYLWTGGPARRNDLDWLGPIIPADPAQPASVDNRLIGDGRPIWVTDLRDAANPRVSETPVDLWRNDRYTDYSHDVDEDARGIAWVSGRGGVRGYATRGRHRDPYLDRRRLATPFAPILVAGGGVGGTAQPDMFMHNAGRPTDGAVRAEGVANGNVLVATEEDFTRPCEASGKIVLSDLTGSLGGEPSSRSTRAAPYRMPALDTFHPFVDTPETANAELECSAHYFEIERSMLGAAWYGQGLRLVDISDARDVRQVGYFRVTGTTDAAGANPSSNAWDMAFRTDQVAGDLLYLFDMSRGVEVLRMRQGARAARRMPAVTAPSVRADPFAARVAGGLVRTAGSDGGGSRYVCPLFT